MKPNNKMLFLTLFTGAALTGCQLSNTNFRPEASPTPSPTPAASPQSGQSINGTIQNLLAMGGPMTCDWEAANKEDGALNGTLLIADANNFRMNMYSQTPDGEFESYVVGNGEWVYYWAPALNQGFRVNQTDLMELGEAIQLESDEQWGLLTKLNQNFNYSCDEWEVDQEEFEIPEGEEFTDITGAINKLTTATQ